MNIVVRVGSVVVVGAYLTFVFISALPDNALRDRVAILLGPQLFAIVGQRWAMFTRPRESTPVVEIRCAPSNLVVEPMRGLEVDAAWLRSDRHLRRAEFFFALVASEFAAQENARSHPEQGADEVRDTRRVLDERWRRVGAVACGEVDARSEAFDVRIIESVNVVHEVGHFERPPSALRAPGS